MSEDRRLPQRMARARIQCAEKIASIEAGGKLKHFRLSSSHIIKDLKKNLARFGVAEDVTLINGRSFDEATIPEVRQAMDGGEVGLFILMRTTMCDATWIATAIYSPTVAGS